MSAVKKPGKQKPKWAVAYEFTGAKIDEGGESVSLMTGSPL